MSAIKEHFGVFNHVNKGVCVIEYKRNSPIIFTNRSFATLLETHPDNLEERSLDEITKAEALHYEAIHPLLVRKSFAVSIFGGFTVLCFSQRPTARGEIIALKIERVKVEEFEGRTFLIGYVRAATSIEKWLNKLKLDTDLSPYIKPAISFFVAGRWRPIATVTSPIWAPAIAHYLPALSEVLLNL